MWTSQITYGPSALIWGSQAGQINEIVMANSHIQYLTSRPTAIKKKKNKTDPYKFINIYI